MEGLSKPKDKPHHCSAALFDLLTFVYLLSTRKVFTVYRLSVFATHYDEYAVFDAISSFIELVCIGEVKQIFGVSTKLLTLKLST
ncbi:hypothetical protein C9J48_07870 [Photobacterium profundum]|uniref:Uncharacterized protein n=1 Tax=Photobacterium profundum 3TCK TaxID=314280 RepID=Q1ZAN7_9GAMM|nr:hypothetical protein [Photobacterium profundum]EAS45455.1 hypothetical protein P3TCK_03741 [Photobacterium profundum 3TCK]PSV63365.1 hypothetical protein C9J48_07870 [Photobacterium profundum]